jgi:DNA-binding transcriptional LysR family regulator
MIPPGSQIPITHHFDARRLSGEADMEMHEIKYFLAACRTLNFHRAAELSHVSQPALTRAVQKLEAELGGHLFHRERNQIRVTDFGRLMRSHLEQVLR